MDMTQAMRVFVTVAESGSLVAAADLLDLSSAAVSRHITALETHLGARLLNRTTRRLSLSGPGEAFFERSQQILADLTEAEDMVSEEALNPSGLLKISAPIAFGTRVLAHLLPDFSKRYPKLRLDIDLTDRPVDLVHDRVDVALRIAEEVSPQLIARKLAPVPFVVCAAPSYLARRGTPMMPEELSGHDTLGYSYHSLGDTWVFTGAVGDTLPVRVHPVMHSNNDTILREFARAGGGVLVHPRVIVAEDIARGDLVPILPEWSIGDYHFYAVYLSRKYLPAKVRVFIDYIVEVMKGLNTRDTGLDRIGQRGPKTLQSHKDSTDTTNKRA